MEHHSFEHKQKVSSQKKLVHRVYRLTEGMIHAHRQNNMQKRNEIYKELLGLIPEST